MSIESEEDGTVDPRVEELGRTVKDRVSSDRETYRASAEALLTQARAIQGRLDRALRRGSQYG